MTAAEDMLASGEQTEAAWASLLAAALPPEAAGPDVAKVLVVFGEGLGLAALYAEPEYARDQCIAASDLFASMCEHRGIEAGTATGFLKARIPPFDAEVIISGHTTAEVPTAGGPIAIDWTARQFDPSAPVPLIVPLADWQAFWRPQ